MRWVPAQACIAPVALACCVALWHSQGARALLLGRTNAVSSSLLQSGLPRAQATKMSMSNGAGGRGSSGFSRLRDRRFWRRKNCDANKGATSRLGVDEGRAMLRAAPLAGTGAVAAAAASDDDGVSMEARVDGSVFCIDGAGRGGDKEGDMGFDLSVWRSFGNFRRNLRETFANSGGEEVGEKKDGWRYMGALVRSQAGILLMSAATLVLAASCDVAGPHYMSRAFNAAAYAQDKVEFAQSLRGMVSYSLLASFFTGLRGACFWLAGTHVVAKVRFDLLSSLLRQDIAFHDENETGALTSRLASDTAKISNVVSFHVNILCRQVIQTVGGLGYLFVLERRLATVALAGVLFVAGVTTVYGRFSRRISAKVQSALAEAGSVAEQSLSLVRVVRAHANEQHERRRYGGKIGHSVELQETQGIAYGFARVLIGWSETLLLGGVLLMGGRMVFDGRMKGEDLTKFLFYTQFVTNASFDVGDQWAKIQEALGAGQKVFELLERKPAIKGRPESSPEISGKNPSLPDASPTSLTMEAVQNGNADMRVDGDMSAVSPYIQNTTPSQVERGRVEFHSVSFGYPTRQGVSVLDGLSLVVRPGEKIAVVGSSGGGKSTILRLLCRFYEPDEGGITLGGRDLSTYDAAEISSTVSWVTQEPQLFPISVKQNIVYGLAVGSFGMEDVHKAAKKANIHNFVRSLPDGYDTLVGEGGASLSGGQKQRVAIARALVRDPEVLLLDEPTSALDVESERLVQDALDKAGEGRTVILVAHRLATIRRADRIVVMQNGRIVESGKHGELLSLGGVYAGLYTKGEQVGALSL